MNYQIMKKTKCDFAFFVIFNGSSATGVATHECVAETLNLSEFP